MFSSKYLKANGKNAPILLKIRQKFQGTKVLFGRTTTECTKIFDAQKHQVLPVTEPILIQTNPIT